jgi:prolyl-tRNA editing enzyme YbaK/EbsC (Cys-tRNA(Pro) deacylase)
MHPTAARFADAAADRHGLDVEVHEFDEGTKTAADAAAAIGCDVAQIASSLVFVADGEPVVVVTSGANRASEARIAEQTGADGADSVEMAGPDEVKAATGWSIGGVPPICHETDVLVLFDRTLLEHETVWAAAGTPDAVWPVAPDRLVELVDAMVADVAEA